MKQLKKEGRKAHKRSQLDLKQDELLSTLGFDSSETLRQKRLSELEQASTAPLFTSGPTGPTIKYPHVFSGPQASPISIYGSRFVLPLGTVR